MSNSISNYLNKTALEESIHSTNPVVRDKAVGSVRRLLREPLRAHEASKKLQKHIPDPKLHDEINFFKDKDPQVDVRPVVKKHLKVKGI